MKSFFYFILVYTFSFISIYGQNKIDQKLKQYKIEENDSWQSLLEKADSITYNVKDYQLAEEYYESAFQLVRKTEDAKGIARLGIISVWFLWNFSHDDQKIQKIERILDYLTKHCEILEDDEYCNVKLRNWRGRVLEDKFLFVDAIKEYNLAIENLDKFNNNNQNILTYCFRGGLLYYLGEVDQARKDYKKAESYLTPDTHRDYKDMVYLSVSASLFEHVADSSIYYSKLVTRNCNNREGMSNLICNKAFVNMAEGYLLKGKPKKALEVITSNIDLKAVDKYINDSLYPSLMHALGAIHYALGDYKKSATYFEISHEYFTKRRRITKMIEAKEDLSKAYEKIGKLQASIALLREIKPLAQTVDSLKITREIAKIETKKILDVKQAKISNLEKQNFEIVKEVSNIRIFSYSLTFFLLLAITVILYRGHNNKVKFHKINEKLTLTRLTALRSSMNPHFLFNTFSTLQNYILKNDNLTANQYMTELSGLIRNVMDSSDSICINFVTELDIIQSYISLQKGRFKEKFDVIYDIEDQLVDLNPKIPSMIIQPFVENSILHGFSHLHEKGVLRISMKKEKDTLVCSVKDNGIGRAASEKLKKKTQEDSHLSIATENTTERLEILNKIVMISPSVVINDLYCSMGKSKGTEVIITLPIIKKIGNHESNVEMFYNR